MNYHVPLPHSGGRNVWYLDSSTIPSSAGLKKGEFLFDRTTGTLLGVWTGTAAAFNLGADDTNPTLSFYLKGLIKHHAHASEGEYAHQLRTESNLATGNFFGMDCEVHQMLNRTAGGVRGLSMTGRIQASKTLSGTSNLIPGYFLLDVDGAINGSGLFAALVAKVDAGGTFTSIGHLASLWVDSLQEGTVTGNHELIYATNNGASTMDSFIYLYAGDKITNLFTIDTATGLVADAVSGDYTFTKTRKIKVSVGGREGGVGAETGYIIVDIPA
jgi:prepilin-type processing-associated H-X9-DG protein